MLGCVPAGMGRALLSESVPATFQKLKRLKIDRLPRGGRYRAPPKTRDAFSVVRSWADCTINMAGCDLRWAQARFVGLEPGVADLILPHDSKLLRWKLSATQKPARPVAALSLYLDFEADLYDLGGRNPEIR